MRYKANKYINKLTINFHKIYTGVEGQERSAVEMDSGTENVIER